MLGQRIAALRRENNMSQAELARRLKISPSAVGMYEQGRREPSAELMVSLAEELGVTTDYLLTGRPQGRQDEQAMSRALLRSLDLADKRLESRPERPFTRQELATIFAAILSEP